MHTEKWEIELLDHLWLGFYDVISVNLEDGSELLIWASHSDCALGPSSDDSLKLLLVSKTPITKQRALQTQGKIKERSGIGWFFDFDRDGCWGQRTQG